MLKHAIMQQLAVRNGGPGLSAREISERLGCPAAMVRQELSGMVFRDKTITCDRQGRFNVGDPTPLLKCRQ